MTSRFPRGSTAYTADGRSYTVSDAEDGVVYCASANGAEMEFPESGLLTADQWAARSDGRRDLSYARIKQSRVFTTGADKIDRLAALHMLQQADRQVPGILDFTAFTMASRVIVENKNQELLPDLSIRKCRAIFDEASIEARISMLADIAGAQPDALLSAAKLGDNMARAMLEKGLASYGDAFEEFCDRPRR